MKNNLQKPAPIKYSDYLTGLGAGILLCPILLGVLGSAVPEKTRWIVWAIGAALMIAAYVIERLSRKP